jgi:hypothetical protein
MKPESEKFNEVLNLLRESKPALDSTNDIEREVIRRISKNNRSGLRLSGVVDFLFSWVYIGWVRRTLIAASAALVLIFIYQQGIIIKRIEVLSKQTVVTEKENSFTHTDEIERLLMAYRNSGKKFPSKTITISESQMDELLESVKELQIKYKDLENLIEGDPELKKLVHKKLIENNSNNFNL